MLLLGLIIRWWGPEKKHLKAHNFLWQECFFFHYYLATSTINWAQIFTGLLFYAYLCWDVPSVKTGLWQLPIVSSVFKEISNLDCYGVNSTRASLEGRHVCPLSVGGLTGRGNRFPITCSGAWYYTWCWCPKPYPTDVINCMLPIDCDHLGKKITWNVFV